MSSIHELGRFVRTSRSSWLSRLSHFGVSGWIGLAIIAFWALAAIFGPALLSRQRRRGGGAVFAPISAAHWLGTDYLGRDMLARVIEGARYTVGVAFIATLLASGTGTLLALFAAASNRWTDAALSRMLDTLTSIPSKMFALLMVAGFGSSVPMLITAAAIIYVPGAYRMARALAVNINALDYVIVARTRGEGTGYVMLREILPNIAGPMLADLGLRFVYVVLLLASSELPRARRAAARRRLGIAGAREHRRARRGRRVCDRAIARHRKSDDRRQPRDRQPAGPRRPGTRSTLMGSPVVVDNLTVTAGSATLVDALSFTIRPGEVLALIGESGSGKTTTALALMGYARRGCRISGGTVRIGDVDVLSLDARQLRALRGRTVAYVAQSAAASFDPSRSILDQVVEPACLHGTLRRAEAELKAIALFRELALPEPETIGQRYPHQVSGGQLQRLMAAMALITDPEVVILDEPTTALDVTTQVEVLRAFRRVVRERQVTAVYVSHDLAVVAQMADHILVLRDGRMRELAATEPLLAAPQNEYTKSLLAAARPAPRIAGRSAGRRSAAARARSVRAGYGPREPRRQAGDESSRTSTSSSSAVRRSASSANRARARLRSHASLPGCWRLAPAR